MAVDPSRHRFWWAPLRLQPRAPAVAAASLALLWSAHAQPPLDGMVLSAPVLVQRDAWCPLDRDVL